LKENAQGMKELRESQKETDRIVKETVFLDTGCYNTNIYQNYFTKEGNQIKAPRQGVFIE